MKVMYVLCTTATETLTFLCEMPKSHDLGHVQGHVIRMSKLLKIAKIYSVRPAVPHCSQMTTAHELDCGLERFNSESVWLCLHSSDASGLNAQE